MLKIGFLGAGKMAQALAKGFLAAGMYIIFQINFSLVNIINVDIFYQTLLKGN